MHFYHILSLKFKMQACLIKARLHFQSRQLPIFPGGHPPSIFGTTELNFRVRYGNGCDLSDRKSVV